MTSLVDILRREEYWSLDFSPDGLGLCIVNSECNRNMLVRLCLSCEFTSPTCMRVPYFIVK